MVKGKRYVATKKIKEWNRIKGIIDTSGIRKNLS